MITVSDYFGSLVFDDVIMKATLSDDVYRSLRKTIDEGAKLESDVANAVAVAMKDWAVKAEQIPIRKIPEITDIPLIWRYFVAPLASVLSRLQLDEKEYVARTVMHINTKLHGAYVFSSGKNMGTFKAVGFPEDVGRFYRLDEYGAYSWTAHGRYPTNTPGWWGGAHPFTLLDYSVVHNGEISSYDANRRFIEMFGYKCTLQTDTEVITYIADYLLRRQGLSLEELRTLSRHRSGARLKKCRRKKLGSSNISEKYILICSSQDRFRSYSALTEGLWRSMTA